MFTTGHAYIGFLFSFSFEIYISTWSINQLNNYYLKNGQSNILSRRNVY